MTTKTLKRFIAVILSMVILLPLIGNTQVYAGTSSVIARETYTFLRFLSDFTNNLTEYYECDLDKIRTIYNFIILNFEYRDGRDGSAVDGSKRPTNVPRIPSFSRRADGVVSVPMDFLDYMNIDELAALIGAWGLLQYGDGVCDDFAALFTLMILSLGMNAKIVSGEYVNRDGSTWGHAWTSIKIDGNWYFFDPQIEASNLTRRISNRTDIPYIWFKQPINNPITQQRYNISRETYISLLEIFEITSNGIVPTGRVAVDFVIEKPLLPQTPFIESMIVPTAVEIYINNNTPQERLTALYEYVVANYHTIQLVFVPMWLTLSEDTDNPNHAFAEIVMVYLRLLGFEASNFNGFYLWQGTEPKPHAWATIFVDGEWYFFDPLIEALTREPNGAISYSWLSQSIADPLTQQRYFLCDRCLEMLSNHRGEAWSISVS